MSASSIQRWLRLFCQVGSATVIHVDLTPCQAGEGDALPWLNGEERARWDRFRHTGARRQFALCRAALRAILCCRLGCPNDRLTFSASQYGKLSAMVDGASAPVSFNVTHGGKHGLIAVAPEGRIGVDVEERAARHDVDELSAAVFSRDEQARIASSRGEAKMRLFFDFWTMKEALIKALGTGFSLDPSQFELPLAMRQGSRSGVFRFPHLPTVSWRLENLSNDDFAAAVAVEMPPETSFADGQGRTIAKSASRRKLSESGFTGLKDAQDWEYPENLGIL